MNRNAFLLSFFVSFSLSCSSSFFFLRKIFFIFCLCIFIFFHYFLNFIFSFPFFFFFFVYTSFDDFLFFLKQFLKVSFDFSLSCSFFLKKEKGCKHAQRIYPTSGGAAFLLLLLLAGTAPSLLPWRLPFSSSSLGWCCSGFIVSFLFSIVFSCVYSFFVSSFFWFSVFCFDSFHFSVFSFLFALHIKFSFCSPSYFHYCY